MSSAGGVEGTGGVQSVGRAFEILEVIAAQGGELSLSEIAASVGLPAPSAHRLLRTLVSLGYLRQETSRRYALAPRLIRLGESAAKQFGAWGYPVLTALMEAIGESANMAILDGSNAIYVAQVAGRHSMRMFTEVGRRVPLHATGVGKALLTELPDDEIVRILDMAGMPTVTPHTITGPPPPPHPPHPPPPPPPAAGGAPQPDPRLHHRRRRAGGRRVLRRRHGAQ